MSTYYWSTSAVVTVTDSDSDWLVSSAETERGNRSSSWLWSCDLTCDDTHQPLLSGASEFLQLFFFMSVWDWKQVNQQSADESRWPYLCYDSARPAGVSKSRPFRDGVWGRAFNVKPSTNKHLDLHSGYTQAPPTSAELQNIFFRGGSGVGSAGLFAVRCVETVRVSAGSAELKTNKL